MAVTNFIQTIWSKKIQDDLELKCKLVQNCLRDYEGDCKYAQKESNELMQSYIVFIFN